MKGAESYGVVADDNGVVDENATSKLREKMQAERPALEVFNFGPGLDALRENCEAETSLPAPKQPQWKRASTAAVAAE